LEALEVEAARFDMDDIASRLALDDLRSEHSADRVDLVLERRSCGRRRVVSPEQVDQLVLGDGLVRVEQEHAQERALLGRRDGNRLAVAPNFQRAQDAELERCHS
jgi:hypothetical protein